MEYKIVKAKTGFWQLLATFVTGLDPRRMSLAPVLELIRADAERARLIAGELEGGLPAARLKTAA